VEGFGMSRERLPSRREATVLEVLHRRVDGGTQRFVIMAGRYDDGRIAEVFIDSGKPTSDSAYLAQDAALILSIAFQHQVPVEALRASVGRGEGGAPHTIIGAVLDALAGEAGQ
jgi:hypothetical protein